MFNFKAYFYGSDVYINEKYRFDSNEILTAYLNDSQWKYLDDDDYIYRLKYLKQRLIVSPDMDYQFYKITTAPFTKQWICLITSTI